MQLMLKVIDKMKKLKSEFQVKVQKAIRSSELNRFLDVVSSSNLPRKGEDGPRGIWPVFLQSSGQALNSPLMWAYQLRKASGKLILSRGTAVRESTEKCEGCGILCERRQSLVPSLLSFGMN